MTANAPSPDRPIVLVGLMGVGKSTVGRRLAARLNKSFVDADAEIEQAAGMTISEMFDRYGEEHFSGWRTACHRAAHRWLAESDLQRAGVRS